MTLKNAMAMSKKNVKVGGGSTLYSGGLVLMMFKGL